MGVQTTFVVEHPHPLSIGKNPLLKENRLPPLSQVPWQRGVGIPPTPHNPLFVGRSWLGDFVRSLAFQAKYILLW